MAEVRRELQAAHLFRLFEEGQCGLPYEASRAGVEGVVKILHELLDRMEGLCHANAA